MIKIAIVGVGFVGGALHSLLKNRYPVILYDPGKGLPGTKQEVNNADIVFLCVPTPFDWKTKNYNYSAIEECLKWIEPGKIVVIKSTVQPGFCTKMSRRYKHKIVFNPEFLREKTANADMKNADRVILGGNKSDCLAVKRVFKNLYPQSVKFVVTSYEIVELTKITTNAFLCAKVSFCNEVKAFCDQTGIDYEDFRKVWLLDNRIGKSHTMVSDEGGFSGSCFPKDLNALITSMNQVKINPVMQKASWEANRIHRKDFKSKKFERE